MAFVQIIAPEEFIGSSSETKPTDGSTSVRAGATSLEVNTGNKYITPDGVSWVLNESTTTGINLTQVNGSVQSAADWSAYLGSIKAAVEIIDNFISTGKGLVIEDSAVDIKTAVQVIDNFISGSRGLVTEDNSGTILGRLDITSSGLLGSLQGSSARDFTTLQTAVAVLGTGVSLAIGSNAIGKLVANNGIDIGDVDVASITAGSNVIGKVRLVTATGDEITDDTQNDIPTHRGKGGLLNSGVLATDTAIKASSGAVYWISVSDTVALNIELNDSPGGTGTDRWAATLPATCYAHYIFDPPIEFGTGVYLDVSTATCKVVVGYI